MSGSISISAPKGPSPTISLAPNVVPSASIKLATGGAPGNITVPSRTPIVQTAPTSTAAPQIYQAAAAPAPDVYAPALDTNAIFNQASSTAAGNVNPYYTKLLNDFITQQGTVRAQQQQQTATNIQNLQDQLTQQLQANQVSGERATEDTGTNEAQINQAADYRQQDQGTAFNNDRNNQAIQLAQSGLTGSGIGANKQATTQETQDTTEARQATADDEAKQVQELTKARTFEDLATSGTNATSTEAKGEKQANFDLNSFITQQTGDLEQQQQQLEQQRQQQLATETGNQTKILVNNFINSIANPAQRQAALQAYGSFL